MKKTSLQILKACSLSVALLGSVAIVAAVSVPDVAFAKSGNDNGGGNGNGGGHGKPDKSDKKSGSDKFKAKKTKSKEKSTTAAKTKAKPKKADLAEELGVHPSELGALNAAHANPNAFANASPNSRVGRIAAYRDAVIAGEELEAALAEKQAQLDGLTAPTRSSADVQGLLDLAMEETETAASNVSALETALTEADPTDLATIGQIETDLANARTSLAEAEAAEAALANELADTVAYETLSGEVADLTQQVEDQPELERSLLEAAANKEVTDEVEAAVRLLLGL
jgi:hypothetical protein